ncbi:MAG TPA: TonB-dependent receptor plug domain-containing protein [Longimicrobiales bacterium]|nr:TonB-dependent receptor plug domain-containing protein [Longimicrobiales bacterium]
MDLSPSARSAAVAACILSLGLVGCGGAGAGPDPNAPRGLVITAEELAGTGAYTVWEALRAKVKFAIFATDAEDRPTGIRTRGRSSLQRQESMLVYLDNVPLSDLRMLQDMPVSRVERIVVLRGPDATTFFGTNAGDGVIQIFTRSR